MSGRVKHKSPMPLSGRRAYKPGTDRIKRPTGVPLQVDPDLLADLRRPERTGLPVTGKCYDCGRKVSGERRYCGPCLAGHP